MEAVTLVAYASRYGSTREVAERIAAHLTEAGHPAKAMPVSRVASLDGFGAVVVGSPFYIGSWLKDANAFLERHGGALASRPVAVFALGPTSRDDDMSEARKQLDAFLEKQPSLHPVAAEMFVGAYDPAKLKGLDILVRVLPVSPLRGRPASDERDWDAIESWAGALPAVLGL